MPTPLHAHDRLPPIPVQEEEPTLKELLGGLVRRLARPLRSREDHRAPRGSHHRVGRMPPSRQADQDGDRHTKKIINAEDQNPASDEFSEQKVN
jgi:hypothetical protein